MQFLLLPFSWLYGLVTDCRNYLYDSEIWETTSFSKPIINVGNLTVGGTGKSPHVEYLIRLLKDKYQVATLSRGYGRKSKGFIHADANANAKNIGDEPLQFYQKFKHEISVNVGENRVEALQKIFAQNPKTDVVILDDAFQHRPVKPSLNLLLVDYSRPIDKDYPFPAGRLRERRHGAKRADAVIVTKCPDLPIDLQSAVKVSLEPYLRGFEKKQSQYLTRINFPKVLNFREVRSPFTTSVKAPPIFFTKILYGKPQNCRSDIKNGDFKKVLLLSGIANPKPFEEYAKATFEVIEHLIYKDHHDFSEKDLEEITTKIPDDLTAILMTEKDMVKFKPLLNHALLVNIPLYYLPIEIGFLEDSMKKDFDELIFAQFEKSI
ncbi:tetraacyldisaccharide 4'-kinase [Arcicella sp. LKC2W]|uniref:tetraacyldisaccharide 4'-kinase n=1 Tax=Arcicella sp. LKC2W TaxID=2984198 RepID=UPI002B218151|nr:tetraacyldisaccharide 4'-kinase [Arcicella sp. LKC2W]MEA5459837.1 tetraacyldisaccharide 4'-kinase [Arcicella sp. LKC2W]